jgi:hypothetical protein
MNHSNPRPARVPVALTAFALAIALAIALGGCSKSLSTNPLPNQPPTVRLTHAPVSSTSREVYAYRMDWVGYDPDGRVDHFVYAVDPKDMDVPDSSWISTKLNEEIIYFKAPIPVEPVPNGNAYAEEFHVFAIRAVDNQGMQSKTVARAFWAQTAAPIIAIQTPTPNQDGQIVTPSVRIQWAGTDPDGLTGKPVEYKFRLFPTHNPDFPAIPDFIQFATSPATRDSFRHLYAPAFGPSIKCPTCTAWDSLPTDSTDVQYTDLVPKQQYLFVVSGFDDAGAYDPIWRVDKNMLLLKVSYAGTLGPQISMYNEFFNFTYTTGGYANDPSRYIEVEVPADRLITINWFATPPPGAAMRRYRWVLDLLELDDETPRTGPNDWYHWSAYGLTNLSATIGPFDPAVKPDHLFFVEAEDNNGLRSLGIVHFTVVRPTFAKDLLVVRDLRALNKDQFAKVGGGLQLLPPNGAWPSRAELDTFMFARGGVPWKGYPAGTLTRPGIFLGYHFDTLSTYQYVTGVTPLSVLGNYKFVLWWTDLNSAGLDHNPTDQVFGISSLRYMSGPNHPSTIATYVKQGGTVWMSGGGVALATLYDWNKRGSDPSLYTDTDLELVPGRFMYDIPHWQSEITISSAPFMKANFNIAPFKSKTPSRGWGGAADVPNYNLMLTSGIQTLDMRVFGDPNDPTPPLRSDVDWYVTVVPAEVLTRGDFITETQNPDGTGAQYSTLDTLYIALGGPAGPNRPVMTYYHGRDVPRINSTRSFNLFSGFPIWDFQRVEQIALVDFVLQELWGLTRDPISRDPMLSRVRAATAVRVATPVRVAPARPTGTGLPRPTRSN